MSKKRSNLLLRLLSSLVLIPLVLGLLWMGKVPFFALVAVVATLATWEYVRLLGLLGYHPFYPSAIGLVWAISLTFFLAETSYLQPAFAVLLITSLAWHVLRDKSSTPIENWLLPLAGALYIGWTSGHMILLRALPQGAYRLFTAFGITWLTDAGAYFVGRTWGKHRMAPRLSPKKTWEGYVGGIVTGVIGGTLLLGFGKLGWGYGALFGSILAPTVLLGDLGVSMIKRQVGVKDTSNLIPGHGGMFDRIDSLLIAAVIGYYYYVWAMGMLGPG